MLALVLGIVASTWLAISERQQRERAEVNKQIAFQAQAEEAKQGAVAKQNLCQAARHNRSAAGRKDLDHL